MQAFISWIVSHEQDIVLLFARLVIAYTFIPLGWQKLMAGEPKWLWLGQQMQYFGVHFWPVAWGFAAACAEFFGGIAMLFGIGVRTAAFFMACVMIVALRMHIAHGDLWHVWWKPALFLALFIVWMYKGADYFSVDTLISYYRSK